jgi:hypothetical protein
MRIPQLTLAALLAGPALCATAQAGVYLESVDKKLDGSQAPTTSKLWFDDGRMRTEGRNEQQVVLFKDQTLYTLDSKTKSYLAIDKATAERMGAQAAAMKKQMEARMAAMSPEQRKRMEEMMAKVGKGAGAAMLPGAKEPQRVLKNSGRTETVAGIKCTVWEVFEDGAKDQEMCAAPAGSLPGGDEVVKTFRAIGEAMKSFTANLGNSGSELSNRPWRDMETIHGVPILTRQFDDGKATSEMRLTVVRKESVPAASFEIPAGYTRKTLPFGQAGARDAD